MILFIDDDDHVENDVEELRFCGYEVHWAGTLDEAVGFLNERGDAVDGVICDVMMLHGKHFNAADTRDGMRAGVKFFEWSRKNWPDLPFVIFTNINTEALRQHFEREAKCLYIWKRGQYGEAFTEQIKRFIPIQSESHQQ